MLGRTIAQGEERARASPVPRMSARSVHGTSADLAAMCIQVDNKVGSISCAARQDEACEDHWGLFVDTELSECFESIAITPNQQFTLSDQCEEHIPCPSNKTFKRPTTPAKKSCQLYSSDVCELQGRFTPDPQQKAFTAPEMSPVNHVCAMTGLQHFDDFLEELVAPPPPICSFSQQIIFDSVTFKTPKGIRINQKKELAEGPPNAPLLH